VEFDPVERITADAVGVPGQRTFYLQARHGKRSVHVLVEKDQVRLLAASILEILQRVGKETSVDAVPDEDLALVEPDPNAWRAGRLSIGYQEERDLLVLDVEELVPEEDERPPQELRIWATREQMLALARHGAAAVAAGRPACQFCGNPIDPEGHWCPGMNGHRQSGMV